MKKNRAGFTLVELLLYMVLLSVLLVLTTDILTTTIDNHLSAEASQSVSADGRFILSRLIYDVGRADNIVIPNLLGDETSSLQIVINGIDYIYDLSGDNLRLTTDLGADQLNSAETILSNLTFKRLGNPGGKNAVQIKFVLTSKTRRKSGLEIKNFQTTVGIR